MDLSWNQDTGQKLTIMLKNKDLATSGFQNIPHTHTAEAEPVAFSCSPPG